MTLKTATNKDIKRLAQEFEQAQSQGIAAFTQKIQQVEAHYILGTRIKTLLAMAYNNRGNAYQKQGNYEDAIKDYNKAIKLNSKLAEAYNNRGGAYEEQGNDQKALDDYNKAIGLKPDYANAYYNRGNAYREQGNYEDAIKDYNKATQLKPDHAAAYNNQGATHYDQGNYEKALEDCNKAIGLKPDDAEAYNNRGNVYRKQGLYQKALDDYNKAIGLKPDYADAYYNRGIFYNEQGNHKDAIKDFDNVIKIEPENIGAFYHLGVSYHLAEDPEEAQSCFHKAQEFLCKSLTPRFPQITKTGLEKQIRKVPTEATSENNELILWFRSHYMLLNEIFYFYLKTMKTLLQQSTCDLSHRVKRLESITAKLERFSTTKLTQMQDIAGNRMIFENLEQLRALQGQLGQDGCIPMFRHEANRLKDYITNPKDDGYRSVHMIFEYIPPEKHRFSPFWLELQLRTQNQHYWATAVEVVDTFIQSRIKQGGGDQTSANWREFFSRASQCIIDGEQGKAMGSQQQDGSFYERISTLEKLREQVKRCLSISDQGSGTRYFLLTVQGNEVTVKQYQQKDKQRAEDAYKKLETDYQSQEKRATVFLTSTDSIGQLQLLYPNYFADTKKFISLLPPKPLPR